MSREWKHIKEDIEDTKRITDFDAINYLSKVCELDSDIEEYINNRDSYILDDLKHTRDQICKQFISARTEYNNVISVKIIVPTYCDANCDFCFNKNYEDKSYNTDLFFSNFENSLYEIVSRLFDNGYTVSLDITGNEPTFNPELLNKILKVIRNFSLRDKICRVVLTSNGLNLDRCAYHMYGIVNYVNISVHHYDFNAREDIFNRHSKITDDRYMEIVYTLAINNIRTSATVVDNGQFDKDFYIKFMEWANHIGFESVRFRANCLDTESTKRDRFIAICEKDIKPEIEIFNSEETADSTWFMGRDKETGLMVYFVAGIENTSYKSLGIEFVINDDGILYRDYNKKIMFFEYPIIFDCIRDKIDNEQKGD